MSKIFEREGFTLTLQPFGNNIMVLQCTFLSIYSNIFGGAISLFSSNTQKFAVESCIFKNCVVPSTAGAIYSSASNTNISKSCFLSCYGNLYSTILIIRSESNTYNATNNYFQGSDSKSYFTLDFPQNSLQTNINHTNLHSSRYCIGFNTKDIGKSITKFSIISNSNLEILDFNVVEDSFISNISINYIECQKIIRCSFMKLKPFSSEIKMTVYYSIEDSYFDGFKYSGNATLINTKEVPIPNIFNSLCPLSQYKKVKNDQRINTSKTFFETENIEVDNCLFLKISNSPILVENLTMRHENPKILINNCQFYQNFASKSSGCIEIRLIYKDVKFDCQISKICCTENIGSWAAAFDILFGNTYYLNQTTLCDNPKNSLLPVHYPLKTLNANIVGMNISKSSFTKNLFIFENTSSTFCNFQNTSIISEYDSEYNHFNNSYVEKSNFIDFYHNNNIKIVQFPEVVFFDCVFIRSFTKEEIEKLTSNCIIVTDDVKQKLIDVKDKMIKKCQTPDLRQKMSKTMILVIVLISISSFGVLGLVVFFVCLRRYKKRQNKIFDRINLEKSVIEDFG